MAPKPLRDFTRTDITALLADWDGGMALLPLSKKWGASRNRLRRLLACEGRVVEPRPARGAGNPRWKGGVTYDDKGYVHEVVYPDDPMFPMSSRGRVLQHRLVMARSIGRPLRSDETVHHRNGKKDDNRLENLQLRSSKHGPGQAWQCRSCGSVDVAAVDLA